MDSRSTEVVKHLKKTECECNHTSLYGKVLILHGKTVHGGKLIVETTEGRVSTMDASCAANLN
jgi:hypothetical protein